MKDIKANILSNKNICANYYKMVIKAPYITKTAKPGQFVQLRCSDGFDPLLRRPLSVHRVREEKGVELLYEVIGKGTEILAKRKPGEFLDVLGPLGNGFELPLLSSSPPSAVLIAGGVGIAPLLFLAEELTKRKVRTTVLIGARTKKLILCEKDFKKLGCAVHIATDDGSSGSKGFVSQLFKKILEGEASKRRTRVYACGPDPMLKCIAVICRNKGLDCQVSLEETMACGIGACLGCAVEVKGKIHKLACKDGPVFRTNELKL